MEKELVAFVNPIVKTLLCGQDRFVVVDVQGSVQCEKKRHSIIGLENLIETRSKVVRSTVFRCHDDLWRHDFSRAAQAQGSHLSC